MKNTQTLFTLLLVVGMLGACSKNSVPQLGQEDGRKVFPCPSQTLLDSPEFREDFRAATAFSFFSAEGSDSETSCQRGAGFLKAVADRSYQESPAVYFRPDGKQTLEMGFSICGDGTENDEIPKAGVYRQDGKFTANGRTYQIRVRSTVAQSQYTGSAVSSLGLTEDQLKSQVVYTVNGSTAPAGRKLHDLLATHGPTVDVTASASGLNLFDAHMEVICASRL